MFGGFTSMLDDMSFTGFSEHSATMSMVNDLKAVSASQNINTCAKKVNGHI